MAAGITYTPIATTTIANSTTAEVTFSSISGYTDLRLIFNGGATAGSTEFQAQVNSDTGNNYSRIRITGSGSAAASTRAENVDFMRFTGIAFLPNGSLNSNFIIDFMNYANTTTNKTVLSRGNHPASEVNAIINLWRSTAAITSIKFYASADYFYAGSTFSLYGIKSA